MGQVNQLFFLDLEQMCQGSRVPHDEIYLNETQRKEISTCTGGIYLFICVVLTL